MASSEEHTFSIPDALNVALPSQPWKGYKTSRSGLAVTLTPGTPYRSGAKTVGVHMDGAVDRADAQQLAEFFTELANRLPPLR